MNVLCIRVPTISREWARKFKKVIFVNHDVTAYFANISSSSIMVKLKEGLKKTVKKQSG